MVCTQTEADRTHAADVIADALVATVSGVFRMHRIGHVSMGTMHVVHRDGARLRPHVLMGIVREYLERETAVR